MAKALTYGILLPGYFALVPCLAFWLRFDAPIWGAW